MDTNDSDTSDIGNLGLGNNSSDNDDFKSNGETITTILERKL